MLADAIALWRGKALADVPPSAFVDAEAERLDELRLAVLELRIEADIACDRSDLAIPDLRRLLTDEPLKEKLWLLLMRALDAAGRHAEALEVYEQARTVIADQLGVDPRSRNAAGVPASAVRCGRAVSRCGEEKRKVQDGVRPATGAR